MSLERERTRCNKNNVIQLINLIESSVTIPFTYICIQRKVGYYSLSFYFKNDDEYFMKSQKIFQGKFQINIIKSYFHQNNFPVFFMK